MQVSVETTQGLERKMTVAVPSEKVDSAVNRQTGNAYFEFAGSWCGRGLIGAIDPARRCIGADNGTQSKAGDLKAIPCRESRVFILYQA